MQNVVDKIERWKKRLLDLTRVALKLFVFVKRVYRPYFNIKYSPYLVHTYNRLSQPEEVDHHLRYSPYPHFFTFMSLVV